MKKYNITVLGAGYVGMSMLAVLAKKNNVIIYDIDKKKIEDIDDGISPIPDSGISPILKKFKRNISVSYDLINTKIKSEIFIIAIPTNFKNDLNSFDTKPIELLVKKIVKYNKNCSIFIKSTVPVGFTKSLRKKYNYKNIYFSPEFLREGMALHDNLYPSRIVIGGRSKKAKVFASLLIDAAKKPKKDIKTLFTGSDEAESIKLFSNTYLAMRIAYFNELDNFSEFFDLNSEDIIKGISFDNRIGRHYNNPSFGYGGYCLPKDTKQLLSSFESLPNSIIKSIIKSNKLRKKLIAKNILQKKPKTVGIYRLVMKNGSENFRESAIHDIIKIISQNKSIKIIVYEPLLKKINLKKLELVNSISEFTKKSDLIIANRKNTQLNNVKKKVYTRDIFNID